MAKIRREAGPAKPVYFVGSTSTDGETVSDAIITQSEVLEVGSDFTGIITVPAAGTEMQGGNVPNQGSGFHIVPHPDNTDTVWVFPWGQTKATGFAIPDPGGTILRGANLNAYGFDADVNGEKICWIKL